MAGVNGRVAMVTGSGRGIGKATADLLAERGANVIGVARSEAELKAAGHEYAVADLGTVEGCERAVTAAEEKVGPVDILVCNHGMGSAHKRVVWEQDVDMWNDTIRINLDGPFHLSRLILKGMTERGYGRVVFTSSTAADAAENEACAYNSSKSGLLGIMRSISLDAAPFGITSNAVLPGWVRTDMAEEYAVKEAKEKGLTVEEIWEERAALYPPGRVVTPEEVAEAIAFLASEESSGISGEAIRVALGGVW